MQLISSALVIDHFGDVLLVNQSGELVAPARPLDDEELPPQAASRAVRELTELIVMPVRLAVLHYEPRRPDGRLLFMFRCIMRGGELAQTGDQAQGGFFNAGADSLSLPVWQRDLVVRGLQHPGGLPDFVAGSATPTSGRWQQFLSLFRRAPAIPEQSTLSWQADIMLTLRDNKSRLLWQNEPERGEWTLPGGEVRRLEAPWQAAQRIKSNLPVVGPFDKLSAVVFSRQSHRITFVFAAKASPGGRGLPESYQFAVRPPDSAPDSGESQKLVKLSEPPAENTAFVWRTDLPD